MSPGAFSYREMALVNIAFAYSQLGDGENAFTYYRRTLEEFPGNQIALAALKMMDAAKGAT